MNLNENNRPASVSAGLSKSAYRELQSNTLQSWKEIAAYLKRGVRTAQRWERNERLPVRRPRPGGRSPVFAFPQEIDEWLLSRRASAF